MFSKKLIRASLFYIKRQLIWMNSNFNLEIRIITGAQVTFEPMFTGLRDICELWKI